MRVGVFGAAGRMGSTVCHAIATDPDMELVAAVDPHYADLDLRTVTGVEVKGLKVAPDTSAFIDAGVEVAVDFTIAEAARANAEWCAQHGVHAVVGTSGFSEEGVSELRDAFVRSNCLIAPNFAIGAVLMIRLAELAAPFFDSAEIIELHHDTKADAPSGTAAHAAERIAAASSQWAADPTTIERLSGARGGLGPGGIRIHSVRARGLVAHHEVILGTTGQSLTLRHDSYDRTSFMPGVLLAVRNIATHPGLTVGLDAFLGF